MQFTRSQISEIFEEILQKESGFNEIYGKQYSSS